MGINSTEVSYGFGQMGSMFTDTANNAIKPPTGKVFVAITFLANTQLEILSTNAGGLTADTSDTDIEYVGTDVAAHNETAGNATATSGELGQIIDNSNSFPKGVTIYGRWTSVEIGNGKSGALIAYIGN
tara:strand:- start:1465 stop:1851 length:387 start_codon:yes stop_codon:yes gene_type:complete